MLETSSWTKEIIAVTINDCETLLIWNTIYLKIRGNLARSSSSRSRILVPSDKHAVHFLVYISSQFFQTLKLPLPSATGLVWRKSFYFRLQFRISVVFLLFFLRKVDTFPYFYFLKCKLKKSTLILLRKKIRPKLAWEGFELIFMIDLALFDQSSLVPAVIKFCHSAQEHYILIERRF